jgi:hypothetical protein
MVRKPWGQFFTPYHKTPVRERRSTQRLSTGGDECSELPVRAVPQSPGRKSVVRGLLCIAEECYIPMRIRSRLLPSSRQTGYLTE